MRIRKRDSLVVSALFLLNVFCLLMTCCSCQKKPRRIIFSSERPAVKSAHNNLAPKVKAKHELSDPIKNIYSPKKSDFNSIITTCESKLTDIPIPAKAVPSPEYFVEKNQTAGVSIGYCCEQNRTSLVSFFKQQMPNFGWRLQGDAHGAESMLLFKKPDRLCIVSLRHWRKNSHGQQLVITIINRDGHG